MDNITPAPGLHQDVLKLAIELGSVAEACRRVGITRAQFNELKRRMGPRSSEASGGKESSLPSIATLSAILEISESHPTWGAVRICEVLASRGDPVTGHLVQRILCQHGLGTTLERVRRVEALTVIGKLIPTPEQEAAVAKLNPAFKERRLQSKGLGLLLCQDTLGFGAIPGIGNVLAQVIIDTHNSYAFGYLHLEKMPEHAAVVLHHDVLPQYRRWGINVKEIMTDRGKEYCGVDTHPYELYLSLHNIEHRISPAPRLAGNGFMERFARIAQDEFFTPAARAKEPWLLELLQEAFLYWMLKYNHETPLSGFPTMGRPPALVCEQTACKEGNFGRVPLVDAIKKD